MSDKIYHVIMTNIRSLYVPSSKNSSFVLQHHWTIRPHVTTGDKDYSNVTA